MEQCDEILYVWTHQTKKGQILSVMSYESNTDSAW